MKIKKNKKDQSCRDDVHTVYSSLEELIAERAGYDKGDCETMWNENRVIGGSVFPKDFGRS